MTHSHQLRAIAPALAALLLALTPCAVLAAPTNTPPPGPPAEAGPPVTTPLLPPTAPIPTSMSPGAVTVNTIHPGDQLSISVYGDTALTGTTIVQSDGTIQYPLIGRVYVLGQTAAEARDTVAKAMSKYLKHPSVSLSVSQQGLMNVMVMGNVKTAGKYALRGGAHLSDAIAAAAGVATVNGDYPPVRVMQPSGVVQTINLQKLLHDGDASQNIELGDNALVYVTGAETIRVQVLGAVTRPGNVEVTQGDRLSMALARAGVETAARPDLNRVFLSRKDPATGKTLAAYQFDMHMALEKGDQRYDPILQKDDTIFIPEARQVSQGTIGLLAIFGRLLGF
jgi:protein involved in polysaccharide export with SLBB domain